MKKRYRGPNTKHTGWSCLTMGYAPSDIDFSTAICRPVVARGTDVSHGGLAALQLSVVALQDRLSALGSLSMPALLTPGFGVPYSSSK